MARRSLSAADRGGPDFNDHRLIWDRFDKVHAKHPDMVLLHGGSPKGAELIAAKWAINRKVPQIAFKPDWTKHAKALCARPSLTRSNRRGTDPVCQVVWEPGPAPAMMMSVSALISWETIVSLFRPARLTAFALRSSRARRCGHQ